MPLLGKPHTVYHQICDASGNPVGSGSISAPTAQIYRNGTAVPTSDLPVTVSYDATLERWKFVFTPAYSAAVPWVVGDQVDLFFSATVDGFPLSEYLEQTPIFTCDVLSMIAPYLSR